MFKFTRPEQSYEELESLVADASAFCKSRSSLPRRAVVHRRHGIRVVETYDIEVWLPSANEFMEISSCSNTEAFQARVPAYASSQGRQERILAYAQWFRTRRGAHLARHRRNYQQTDGSVVIRKPAALCGTDRIPASSKLIGFLLHCIQKKGRVTRVHGLLALLCDRTYIFPMAILSTWTISPSIMCPVTSTAMPRSLSVFTISDCDFCDLLGLGIYENV